MTKFRNYIPISILLLVSLVIYFSGYHQMISFDTLREHHKELREIALEYKFMAPLIFTIVFAVSIAFSIPGGFFLSLFSGFLFPHPWGILCVILATTLGGMVFYLSAKVAFQAIPREKGGSFFTKIDQGFRKNAASYMVSLRLMPFIPFWIANCTAAFFNVPLQTFLWTTFLGMAPHALFYAHLGSRLNRFFETSDKFSLGEMLNFEGKIILMCLGFCALIPMIVKKWLEKRAKNTL